MAVAGIYNKVRFAAFTVYKIYAINKECTAKALLAWRGCLLLAFGLLCCGSFLLTHSATMHRPQHCIALAQR